MRKAKNILILEAGGPCGISTIKILKRNHIGTIFAADMDPYSPAFSLSDDALVIPPASSEDFTRVLSKIIDDNAIDIVMPTFENGFKEINASDINKDLFVTDFSSAMLCKNKHEFSKNARSAGLPVPQTWYLNDVSEIKHPVYIKPNMGVGSRDNFIANTNEEFLKIKVFLDNRAEYIVQELLLGEHWNIDVLVDNGKFMRAIPRRDLKQKAGNCITVNVQDDKELIQFAEHVTLALNIKSPFNLELFRSDSGLVINEINVRFGGGIIFTALAGVDIVSYTATKDAKYLGNIRNSYFSRYYEEIEVTGKL